VKTDEGRGEFVRGGQAAEPKCFFLARRALAALRRFAMRPRAYLIGSASNVSGSLSRVGDRFEQLVEAWDAAAILGRSIPFATDEMRIGDAGLASADIAYNEQMLPAITEVVSIIDDGLSRLEHVAQAHLARRDARPGSPVIIHRQTVPLLANPELPEVVIEPPHNGLDDVVQDLERDRVRTST
jgi:hypothetical protein